MKEFGLDQNTSSINRTYPQENKPTSQVISDQTTFLKNKFDLQVD